MVKLEPVRMVGGPPMPRLWLIFFTDGEIPSWLSRWLSPGFRHVSAAAWYAAEERWVYYNPGRRGTSIEIFREHEFDGLLGHLMATSGAVLRVPSRFARNATPATWHCVGAVKALLGISACELWPSQLHRHLLAHGAETVEVPNRVVSGRKQAATASPGGPERQGYARARAGAG